MRVILAASDLTDLTEEGLRAGAAIARTTGAALHVLQGAGAVGLTLREAIPHLEPGAQQRLRDRLRERVRAALDPAQAEATECHASVHDTLDALPGAARELEADLVVVGAAFLRRPSGLAALGRLRRGVGCPVLVARADGGPPYRNVLVAVGGEDLDAGTLQAACEWLAPLYDAGRARRRADIHVLHVASSLREWREAGAPLEQAVREAESLTWWTGLLHEHVGWAQAPAGRILESAADEQADLVVLGPRRPRGAGRADPHTWETVASEARCSVLLMPAGRPRGAAAAAEQGRPELEPVLSA